MIIGITGTDGAGKGTVVEYLAEKKGFTHYSLREVLTKELKKQGRGLTRNDLRLMGNELRAQEGNDVLATRSLDAIAVDGVERAIIESIRALAEAKTIKAAGGLILAVDADPLIRYQRVQERRSSSDHVSYEEFSAHEAMEKNDPDPHGMQKAAVIDMADVVVLNNTTKADLYAHVEAFCEQHGL